MNDDSDLPVWRHVVGTALAGCLFVSLALAENPPPGYKTTSPYSVEIARIGATQADAKIQRAGEAQYKRVQTNAPVYLSDFLATGKASKIWWKDPGRDTSDSGTWAPLPEVTHGSLGEHSVFGFLNFHRVSLSSNFVGQVPKGIVRFIKRLPRTDPPSSFSIATPTAWIDVVPTDRAADFVVETHDESRSTITVVWGEVRVKNVSEKLVKERILTSCQEVDVEKDQDPGEVRWVSTDTMKNLIKRTTIPNTLPTDVPSCERLKSEIIRVPGAVYIPPPGAVVVPVPIPVPPPPGEKCPCPCPPNHQLLPGYGCVPCRGLINNIGSTDGPLRSQGSATINGSNGSNGQLRPGREASCTCDCPCPQGQVLLPGRGCVPECPPGFSVSYDASENPPFRCPYCRRGSVPLTGCSTDQQCGRCETCVSGNCIPKTCPRGQVLNRENCSCQPLDRPVLTPCSNSEDCGACQRCKDGECVSAISCGPQERLNRETCQCERISEPLSVTLPPAECGSNSDCGEGQICRKGKCVKRPPPRPRPTQEEEPQSSSDAGEEESSGTTVFQPPFRGGFGIGIGIGGGGRGGGGPSRPPSGPPKGRPN